MGLEWPLHRLRAGAGGYVELDLFQVDPPEV